MGDFLITAPDGRKYKVTGETPEGALAAIQKMTGGQPAQQAQSAPQPAQSMQEAPRNRWNESGVAMVNDIGAGLQGVNPVALQQQTGTAVGSLRKMPGGGLMVDVDGTLEPLENYPADRFVTRLDANGTSYIYPRTAEIEEGRAASAGRLLGYGVVEQLGSVARTATGGMSKAADDIGVTPSLGMRSKFAGQAAAAGEQFLPTAGPIKRDYARVTDEIGAAATRIADRVGPGITPVEAGEAAQRGAKTFISRFRDKENLLYRAVDAVIPPRTSIQAPKAAAFIEGIQAPFDGLENIAKRTGATAYDGVLADLKSGNLTWEAARRLRSEIGAGVGSIKGPLADMSEGQLKGLYAALSDDLAAAASAAGPEATKAWSRATTYSRAANERIETALKSVTQAPSAEAAYSKILGMTAEGTARANVKALNGLFKSLPRDESAVVAGTLIRRLGRATNGAQDAAGEAFSASTFLTNWNKMSKEARAIIARNGMDPGARQELNKLAEVAEAFKKSMDMRNTSNTGNVGGMLVTGAAYGATQGDPVKIAILTAALGAGNISARALTSPVLLRAVNKAVATGRTDALKAIAASNSPLAIEAATILRLQAPEASPSPSPAGPTPVPR